MLRAMFIFTTGVAVAQTASSPVIEVRLYGTDGNTKYEADAITAYSAAGGDLGEGLCAIAVLCFSSSMQVIWAKVTIDKSIRSIHNEDATVMMTSERRSIEAADPLHMALDDSLKAEHHSLFLERNNLLLIQV